MGMINRAGVVIVCGSGADGEHAGRIADAARALHLDAAVRVASAHRTPEHALAIVREVDALAAGFPVVLITVAGRSNALSGFSDPQTTVPVIACPPPAEVSVDIWSSVRMPAGVAPLFVLEPANAALAAAKIIGLSVPEVAGAVRRHQAASRDKVLAADADATGGIAR